MGTPSLMAAQSLKIIQGVNQASANNYRRADCYALVAAGGTGIAAAAWVVTLSFTTPAGILTTPYRICELASSADDVLNGASETWDNSAIGAARYRYAAYVVDCSSGSAATTCVWSGTVSETAGGVALVTDAEISASLGHHDWVRLADTNVALTGGSAVSETITNIHRSGLSIGEFNGGLFSTEDGFNG